MKWQRRSGKAEVTKERLRRRRRAAEGAGEETAGNGRNETSVSDCREAEHEKGPPGGPKTVGWRKFFGAGIRFSSNTIVYAGEQTVRQ